MSSEEPKQTMMTLFTPDCMSVLGDFDFLVLIVETSWFVTAGCWFFDSVMLCRRSCYILVPYFQGLIG